MSAVETRTRGPRDRILQAAAEAIADHGYHGMTMRQLAREAGTSLANLYNYFPSKEEILFALQKEAFEVLLAAVEETLAGVRDPGERLYAFISHHVRYFAAHPEVMRVLVHEAASLPAPQRRVVRDLKERYFLFGREILRELSGDGCPRQEDGGETGGPDEVQLSRLTYSVFGMLNWIYGWYDPSVHGSPQDLARTIHQIVVGGAVNRCPLNDLQESVDHYLSSVESPPLLGSPALGDPPR